MIRALTPVRVALALAGGALWGVFCDAALDGVAASGLIAMIGGVVIALACVGLFRGKA